MADAAVEFLLNNLLELAKHNVDLIKNAKSEVEMLKKDLLLFKTFLDKTIKLRRKDKSMAELAKQIRDVVYEAEDIIDTFVTQAVERKTRSRLVRAMQAPVNLLSIAKQVQSVGSEVKAILGDTSRLDFASLSVGDGGHEEKVVPTVRKNNVVGFQDEAKKIIGYLYEETYELDVISVIGMPGLGKTTLAGMIFRDQTIEYDFPIRLWVYISQEFTMKDVFLTLLSNFTLPNDDMNRKNEQELAQLVAEKLQSGNFLIVLDDVWTAEDWNAKLRIAFPEKVKMGKVLITSRHKEVAVCSNHNRLPHMLRSFTQDEGWELLQLEVFGKLESPVGLEPWGRFIVDKCHKLPLAIVVIGGFLVQKNSVTDGTSAMIKAWTKVSNRVSQHLTIDDPTRRMEKIIALSYDKLPHHLKACFLYLGMFPEDFEIPVWKLTRMWIAEGFIQQTEGNTLEETAYNYLDELINRNLVRKEKMTREGKVKTCRIHDMLRDYCRIEAGNDRENFLQEIKMSSEGTFYPPIAEIHKYRRLCIHSNIKKFVSSKLDGSRVRSFVCFSKEDVNDEKVLNISSAFKLLRVLEAKPMKFSKIPSDMYQLVHLKYITLSFNLEALPQNFSKLWNIQTLILHTTSPTLEIKADIWKFMQLRHFEINARATLPKIEKNSEGGEKIQTLGTISPESCTEEVLSRVRNVKKLGIRGKLNMLLDSKNVSFESLGKFMTNLEKLKLINDAFPDSAFDYKFPRLPPVHHFPRKLRRLTLVYTYLEWTYMSNLGQLENLEVLKLKNNAFMGISWDVVDGGFRNLEVLLIEETDLTIWTASGNIFPKLRTLELKKCGKLQKIPINLADVTSFHSLDIQDCTKYAADSANAIRSKKAGKAQTVNSSEFNLTIFPLEK